MQAKRQIRVCNPGRARLCSGEPTTREAVIPYRGTCSVVAGRCNGPLPRIGTVSEKHPIMSVCTVSMRSVPVPAVIKKEMVCYGV